MDYNGFDEKKRAVLHKEHEDEEPTEELRADQPETCEDEDSEHFIEPFSLLSNLVRETFAQPQVPTETHPVLEIIRYTPEKQVLGYDQVNYRGRYRLGGNKRLLIRFDEPLACRLFFSENDSGGVISGHRTAPLNDLKTESNLAGKHRGQKVYSTMLMKGDYANLVHPGGGCFVRFTMPPALEPSKKPRKFDMQSMKIFGSVFFLHAFFLVVLGLLSPKVHSGTDRDMDQFARVSVKDLSVTRPEDQPEIPPLPLPDTASTPKKVEEKTEPKPTRAKQTPKPGKKRGVRGGGKGSGGGGGGAGMLAALSQTPKPNAAGIVASAATNLDAVRDPSGRSRYKVSGMVTRAPTSDLIVSRGRGIGTKGSIDLLPGGKGKGGPGWLGGGTAGKGKVRAMVMTTPRHKIKTRKGYLDKAKIAWVVKSHTHEIQYCYEKHLLRNPRLKGKLIMEWIITLEGTVSVVYTRFNSLQTPAVARCVRNCIKQWRFPHPKGGYVEVEIPFHFESRSF